MSRRTLVAVGLTTAVIGLSSAGSEAAKNFSRYYVEAQKDKSVEAPAPRPRSTTAERNRPVVPRKPIGAVLPQIAPPEDVAATEPPKRAAKPQKQARAAVEVEAPGALPVASPPTEVTPKPDIPDVAFELPVPRKDPPPPKPVAKPERLARLVPANEAAQDVDRKAAIVLRPAIDLAPRPDVPDIPFAVPAIPSVPKASAAIESKSVEPPAARKEPPPPKPVAKPERLARLVPTDEAAQDVDRKAAVVVRPAIDLAPRPDVPDIPFAAPAVPTVPQSIATPVSKETARAADAAHLPRPIARPHNPASVAVAATSQEKKPASPSVPERLEVDKAPPSDAPDIAIAPPLPKARVELRGQASLEPVDREPSSATASVLPPTKIVPNSETAPTAEMEVGQLPTPPRKLPHVAPAIEEQVQENEGPLRQARVGSGTKPAEALIEPVQPAERKARPEIDMAPRPDTPDTVFIIPQIVARNAAALDTIARLTGSVTRAPKPEADMARSGSPATRQESPRQGEAALDVPSESSKAGTGAEAPAAATAGPPATVEDSACEKAKTALAGNAFTDLQAKSCTGIVFSFTGKQQGKTYSIKFGPLTGEYIAIQQASSASTGLSLEVLRGKVDEASQTE